MTLANHPALDRREFLRKSGVAAAALVMPSALGRHAAGTGQTGSAISLPARGARALRA